jgi:hypothetical protein
VQLAAIIVPEEENILKKTATSLRLVAVFYKSYLTLGFIT